MRKRVLEEDTSRYKSESVSARSCNKERREEPTHTSALVPSQNAPVPSHRNYGSCHEPCTTFKLSVTYFLVFFLFFLHPLLSFSLPISVSFFLWYVLEPKKVYTIDLDQFH